MLYSTFYFQLHSISIAFLSNICILQYGIVVENKHVDCSICYAFFTHSTFHMHAYNFLFHTSIHQFLMTFLIFSTIFQFCADSSSSFFYCAHRVNDNLKRKKKKRDKKIKYDNEIFQEITSKYCK